jgi:tetratricopeptide (TPR) repeat protein
MHKLEKITLGLLGLFYFNKVCNIAEIKGFFFLNTIVFLIIIIGGFRFYKQNDYSNKTKAKLFAIYCGVAFSTSIIGISIKIWNYSNLVTLILSCFNYALLPILILALLNAGKSQSSQQVNYYKSLLIRCVTLIVLSISIVLIPEPIINTHLNREEPILYNRGLADEFYTKSIELSKDKKFAEGLLYAKKSLEAYKIGYNNKNKYTGVYECFYDAYWGLAANSFKLGAYDEAFEYIKLIKEPTTILYGKNKKQDALIKTIEASIYLKQKKFHEADSLYNTVLKLYKDYFKTKNVYYSTTLQLLATSYREQRYYTDAIQLYKAEINLLKKDTNHYASNTEDNINIINNLIASANSDIGWTYYLKVKYDSADIYFNKAFATKTYVAFTYYSNSLTQYATSCFYKGDFQKAKPLMEKALKIALNKTGEISFDYLSILNSLNSLNISLANYTEAKSGCNKALTILSKLTSNKNDYYGLLLSQLANIQQCEGDYNECEKLFNEALSYTNQKSSQYADIIQSLSSLKADLSKYTEAFLLAKQATKLSIEYYQKETSPSITTFLRNEAYVNYLIGNINESEKIYQKCYSNDTTNKILDKIGFAETLNGLGLVKTRLNKYHDADTLFNASLKLYQKQVGKNHPGYATVLYNKACLKFQQGNYTDAETLFNQSLEIITKTLGNKHDKIADNLVGLGEIRLKEKKTKAASDYFTKALTIY